MKKEISDHIDDFSVTKSEFKLTDALRSYAVFKEKLNELPKQKRPKSDIEKAQLFREIHENIATPTLFRKSDSSNSTLSLMWFRRAKKLATMFVALNNVVEFKGISKQDLKELSSLTQDLSNLRKLEEILLAKGIVLVFERSLQGANLDGACYLIEAGQALIAMSLRYGRVDNFWFTLMHELSHLVLHSEQLSSPIIDDLDSDSAENITELEADKLALNSLIPKNLWRTCPAKYSLTPENVIKFSEEIGVHPAIVAGRLRKELNRWDLFSDLVNEHDVREFL